jgi:hypothetical protein
MIDRFVEVEPEYQPSGYLPRPAYVNLRYCSAMWAEDRGWPVDPYRVSVTVAGRVYTLRQGFATVEAAEAWLREVVA